MTETERRAELSRLSASCVCGAALYSDLKCGLTDAGNLTVGLDENGNITRVYYDDTADSRVFSADGQTLTAEGFPPEVRVMTYRGSRVPASEHGVSDASGDVAAATACARLWGEDGSSGGFYRLFTRSRRGYAFIFYTGEKAAPTAAGCIAAVNEKYAVIANVFTSEGCRGRGLAGAVVNECVAAALKKGLIPVLFCREETAAFYKKLGFSEDGNG